MPYSRKGLPLVGISICGMPGCRQLPTVCAGERRLQRNSDVFGGTAQTSGFSFPYRMPPYGEEGVPDII